MLPVRSCIANSAEDLVGTSSDRYTVGVLTTNGRDGATNLRSILVQLPHCEEHGHPSISDRHVAHSERLLHWRVFPIYCYAPASH